MIITGQNQAEAIGETNRKALSQQPKITEGIITDQHEMFRTRIAKRIARRGKTIIKNTPQEGE